MKEFSVDVTEKVDKTCKECGGFISFREIMELNEIGAVIVVFITSILSITTVLFMIGWFILAGMNENVGMVSCLICILSYAIGGTVLEEIGSEKNDLLVVNYIVCSMISLLVGVGIV